MKTVNDMPANDWESYVPVANHPEYPSATASYCGASAQVKTEEEKTRHVKKLAINKRSKFFAISS